MTRSPCQWNVPQTAMADGVSRRVGRGLRVSVRRHVFGYGVLSGNRHRHSRAVARAHSASCRVGCVRRLGNKRKRAAGQRKRKNGKSKSGRGGNCRPCVSSPRSRSDWETRARTVGEMDMVGGQRGVVDR